MQTVVAPAENGMEKGTERGKSVDGWKGGEALGRKKEEERAESKGIEELSGRGPRSLTGQYQ